MNSRMCLTIPSGPNPMLLPPRLPSRQRRRPAIAAKDPSGLPPVTPPPMQPSSPEAYVRPPVLLDPFLLVPMGRAIQPWVDTLLLERTWREGPGNRPSEPLSFPQLGRNPCLSQERIHAGASKRATGSKEGNLWFLFVRNSVWRKNGLPLHALVRAAHRRADGSPVQHLLSASVRLHRSSFDGGSISFPSLSSFGCTWRRLPPRVHDVRQDHHLHGSDGHECRRRVHVLLRHTRQSAGAECRVQTTLQAHLQCSQSDGPQQDGEADERTHWMRRGHAPTVHACGMQMGHVGMSLGAHHDVQGPSMERSMGRDTNETSVHGARERKRGTKGVGREEECGDRDAEDW